MSILTLRRKEDPLAAVVRQTRSPAFWKKFSADLSETATPVFEKVFEAGVTSALGVAGASELSSVAAIALDELAEQAMRDYVFKWTDRIQASTYEMVQDAIVRARRDGTGVEGVLRSVEHLFAPERAQRIAVTETTRLFGVGAQTTYRAIGIPGWEWLTVSDNFVCAICTGLSGEQFDMKQDFSPAHVNCRCFPRPMELDVKTPPVNNKLPTDDFPAPDPVAVTVDLPKTYHYTRAANVDSIKKDGLRQGDGVFGKGVYLTDASSPAGLGGATRLSSDIRIEVTPSVTKPLILEHPSQLSKWLDSVGAPDDADAMDVLRDNGFDALVIPYKKDTWTILASPKQAVIGKVEEI